MLFYFDEKKAIKGAFFELEIGDTVHVVKQFFIRTRGSFFKFKNKLRTIPISAEEQFSTFQLAASAAQ